MKRDYKYRKFDLPGFAPLIQLNDPPYCQEDLFELAGSRDFTVTVEFMNQSESKRKYGDSVTGTIFYPKGTRDQIQKCIGDGKEYPDPKIRIMVTVPRLPVEHLHDLKYDGIPIDHIESVMIVPYRREQESKDGVKNVPNIVRIPVSARDFDVDPDVLWKNFMLRKLSSGTELIPEEKAQLVGSVLAYNGREIAPELLKVLGYSTQSASEDSRIWYHYYQIRKKAKDLSDEEIQKIKDAESTDLLQKALLLSRELVAGHEPGEQVFPPMEQLSAIWTSLKQFRPKVLIPIKRQIWWDTSSYLHIVLRHVKDFQLGRIHSRKTPFPYAFEELELLIEKVLDSVVDEIKAHFNSENTNRPFYRTGRMSTYYNEDYYSFRIGPSGLLETIYIVETGMN